MWNTKERRAVIAAAKHCGPELLGALKAIREITYDSSQSQETRLNDIYDMANEVVEKIEQGAIRKAAA